MQTEKSPHCPDTHAEKFHHQIREQKVQKGLQAFVPEHSGALHRKTVVKINFPRGIQIPELADPVKQRRKSSHRKTTHHKAIPP